MNPANGANKWSPTPEYVARTAGYTFGLFWFSGPLHPHWGIHIRVLENLLFSVCVAQYIATFENKEMVGTLAEFDEHLRLLEALQFMFPNQNVDLDIRFCSGYNPVGQALNQLGALNYIKIYRHSGTSFTWCFGLMAMSMLKSAWQTADLFCDEKTHWLVWWECHWPLICPIHSK